MKAATPRSTVRLFATYAAITLVPVLVLGIALAASLRAEAQQRGLSEGRSEAALVAHTAVEPLLDGRSLNLGLSRAERSALQRLTSEAVRGGDVLRLRVRNLNGQVLFSDDGSGFRDRPEDEALDAARGVTVARLTRVNTDTNDHGRSGVSSVEVYLPLSGGHPARRLGVLEMYLPYAPINRDVTAGLQGLYRDLAIGLALLYLAIFAITLSVSRGLRRELARNRFLAEHDPLTRLPNRTLFHRSVAAALRRSGGPQVVVAIIDLDHFKDVNDSLGHHNGDRLIEALGERIAAHLHTRDTVARLGGDEFGLILHEIDDPEQALGQVRAIIERELEVGGLPLSVQASIGYVVAPSDGTDADALLQHADAAMYVAKAQHAGVVRYDATRDHYDAANLALVSELRRAIDADELVLHYQPQALLADGRLKGVEALVRWQHPTHGLLYPDRFLPLAEQTDLIDRLTTWVLRTALTDIRDLGPAADSLTVSVNVSARSIGRADLAREIIDTLDHIGVPAQRLIIEVTETALMTDPQRAAAVLKQLSDHGVHASLDDFGQGQTSLGYLSALPLDELKIDKSFVFNVLENPAHGAIVRSIIDLGHNLGLDVVGEGVETQEVLDRLRDYGCDHSQGYLLARPMPLSLLRPWLQSAMPGRVAA